MTDIIVVGAGTAGLTSAIYGLRAGKSVRVFEENMYGGQIVNTPSIENFPAIKNVSGYEFSLNLYEQAKNLGMEYINENVTGIEKNRDGFTVMTHGGTYEAKAIILATGAKNRKLGLTGEEKFTGKGVSYCATCDGAFFRGKAVAVAGGGNTAIEDGLFLSNYCSKVYVVHRRDDFRGDKADVEKLKAKENVEFVLGCTVEELMGDDRLTGIKVKSVSDESIREISVNGLFIAIGQAPDNERFVNIVELDDRGYIVAGEDCRTGTAGVFTAGDCRTKAVRQLVTAAADGAVAGLAAAEV